MSQIVSILTLIGALGAGILLGRVPFIRGLRKSRAFGAIRNSTLYLLVFTMGFRIGRTGEVARSMQTLGIAALAFSLATITGTVVVLALLFALRERLSGQSVKPMEKTRSNGSTAFHILKDPLTLLLVIVAGFLMGFVTPLLPHADGALMITVVLYILLVIIGIGLGAGGVKISDVVTHPDLILLPIGTAVGSLAGGLAAGLLVSLPVGTSLALSAGFGWYSLSGVILTRLDGPLTGSIAFLSNMLRESISLLLIPLLARTRFPYLAIGAGGATSMDVTLPLIEKNCGPRSVGFAMASGGLLSLAVPVLVPLMFSIGR